MLTQAAWGLFQSGLLCLGLDSFEIGALTGGEIDVTAGLLMNFEPRLLGLAQMQAPIQLTITARDAPRVRLGAGVEIAEGVHDPLLQIALDDVQIDISMLIDDAMLRISGLNADVALNMDIIRQADHSLQLAVHDIEVANTQQIYNELVPDADLTQLFETLIDIAIDLMVGDNLNFDIDVADVLGDALGTPVELRLNTVRRDIGPTGSPYISVYASLCSPAQVANPEDAMCYQPPFDPNAEESQNENGSAGGANIANTHSMYRALPRADLPPRWLAVPSGQVQVQVADTASRKYQYRVDGGAWWTASVQNEQTLLLKSPKLYRHGYHDIELRSHANTRFWYEYNIDKLTVLVDPDKPVLSALQIGSNIEVSIDELTTPESVSLFVRNSHNETNSWVAAVSPISVSGLGPWVEIMARDAAGNESEILKMELFQHAPGTDQGSLQAHASDDASGCAAASIPSLWLLLAGLFAFRKRLK